MSHPSLLKVSVEFFRSPDALIAKMFSPADNEHQTFTVGCADLPDEHLRIAGNKLLEAVQEALREKLKSSLQPGETLTVTE